MTKSDYFTDSNFQLELNLHNIRRELILMIEEFEKQDCLVCFQLKCLCSKPTEEASQNTSIRSQDNSVNNSKENTPNKAPPAVSLPKPTFYYEALDIASPVKENNKGIDAWIQASKTAHNVRASNDRRITTDVLATLRKYWSENNDMKKGRILNDFKKDSLFDSRLAAANAVDVFFKNFKEQPVNNNITEGNISFINKNAAGYLHPKSRGSEYSYF